MRFTVLKFAPCSPVTWALGMLGALLVVACGSASRDKFSRPNVIVILADDLGYGDVGAYNRHSKVPTPHIDQLASEGIMLTEAYCPVAVCSPSRYALMTGTYPWRSWNKSGVMKNYERSMIAPDQLTLPQMFKEAGYETAGFGKWHLGTSFPTIDGEQPAGHGKFYAKDNGANLDFAQPVYDGPLDHGFDQWLGFSCASEGWVLKDKQVIGALEHDFYTVEQAPGSDQINMIPMDSYLPMITGATLEFLKDRAVDQQAPFFLYYAPYVPHVPLAVSKDFLGTTEGGAYGDYVSELDHYVGSILQVLDSLQLTENTIVLFASDNGSQFLTTSRDMDASSATNRLPGHFRDSLNRYGAPGDLSVHHPNGTLRGVKSTAWEGGVRTPFIARWPGHFPAGGKSDQLLGLNDVMATLAPVAGYELENGSTTDGFNLLSVLQGENENKRTSIVVQSSGKAYGLRDRQWKIIEVPGKNGDTYYELYNLRDDPSESNNLAEQYPGKVREMRSELHKILAGSSTAH
ncbi:arylsulfatase [Echinicola soli]|uniref:Arylsulfatase n=1 Tax=Echinicola soli TaxID=2591634 RepID=A0A514CN92_9BACT|nr:arylsulfatase [Echinicola soli]QDH81293.1 arylsulfatase [Echinicola soli]